MLGATVSVTVARVGWSEASKATRAAHPGEGSVLGPGVFACLALTVALFLGRHFIARHYLDLKENHGKA